VNEQVSQHQVIDICSNPQGALIQDLEKGIELKQEAKNFIFHL